MKPAVPRRILWLLMLFGISFIGIPECRPKWASPARHSP
jgi:hypothetical protein